MIVILAIKHAGDGDGGGAEGGWRVERVLTVCCGILIFFSLNFFLHLCKCVREGVGPKVT